MFKNRKQKLQFGKKIFIAKIVVSFYWNVVNILAYTARNIALFFIKI